MYKSIFNLVFAIMLINILIIFSCERRETQEISIGAILPLTGKAAQYGNWIKDAMELRVEEINNSGGIDGYDLKIIYEDDQALPKLAANTMEKLCSVDNVPIVFGSWASSSVLAQAPIAEKYKVVVMGEAISPKIRDAGDYIFRIQPDAKLYLKKLIPFIYNSLDIKDVAIIYANNDFGEDQYNFFKSEFRKIGGNILYEEGFPQGTSNFRNILIKVKKVKPKAIFAPCYTEIGTLLKQAKELKIDSKFIASVPFENPVNLATAGGAAEGVIYPYHFVPDSITNIGTDFIAKYYKRYSRYPEGFAVLAYDGIRIIGEVLKKCNNNSQCIKNELYKIKDFKGITGNISFDKYGEVTVPIFIKTVKNGEFVLYKDKI